MNDVIARLGTIAQSQGKRLADMLGQLVKAVTEASKSDPQLLDPKAQKLARTTPFSRSIGCSLPRVFPARRPPSPSCWGSSC